MMRKQATAGMTLALGGKLSLATLAVMYVLAKRKGKATAYGNTVVNGLNNMKPLKDLSFGTGNIRPAQAMLMQAYTGASPAKRMGIAAALKAGPQITNNLDRIAQKPTVGTVTSLLPTDKVSPKAVGNLIGI